MKKPNKKLIFEIMNPAENYILNQKEPLQSILLFVRQIIFTTIPEMEEKYKYKIPFYYYKGKPVCYLNILKGTNYVDLGFWDGFKLPNKHHLLKANNRKMVKSLEFKNLETINVIALQETILEAVAYKISSVK